MPRKPKTARMERRIRARVHEDLVRDLEKLAALQPGGTPARPIVVASPALVDVIAAGRGCPLCDAALALEEHAVEVVDGVALRVARMRCAGCGVRRVVWFRIGMPLH